MSDNTIFDDFKKLTNKDIEAFFNKTVKFFRTDYVLLVGYYSGKFSQISSKVFERLDSLQLDLDDMFEKYHQHSASMKDIRYWNLLEQIEEVDNRIKTARNINRWARSSATNVAYSPTIQLEYTLSQNQTLENVSRDILEQAGYQDDWFDIAMRNVLEEEDYDLEGGQTIQLELDKTLNLGIIVNSVVDYLSGKSIYGKDIYRKFSFENEDIKVLGYDDTIVQAVDILIGLKKNDNPDYPYLGLQSTVIVGGNQALLNFPVIIRQLTETFQSDDTLKEFQINTIKLEQDNLLSEFQVKTRLNEIYEDTQLL